MPRPPARKVRANSAARSTAPRKPILNVSPDKLDLRDRPYLPAVAVIPPGAFRAKTERPVLNQAQTSACTGFSLATVVNHLLLQAGRAKEAGVSPWMLYSMARRYDEFPGADEDTGSSLRGALKGWFKHGACAKRLWDDDAGLFLPPASNAPGQDWWLDAVNRPLGAYYRIDTRSVTDMHVALNEVGVIYASALCHDGWMKGTNPKVREDWAIPFQKAKPGDGGHAFAIVGYDARGFLVQNSWGVDWGDGGFATLTYEDWLEHAMDCWVAQLGVVTQQHRDIAAGTSPLAKARGNELPTNPLLRANALAPYVIDMENNGQLSKSGNFRTSVDDVRALVTDYLGAAVDDWKIRDGEPIDVVLYAHGGLVGEADAAATFAKWYPALYAKRKFPIFLMWESDLWSTIVDRLADIVKAQPRPTGGPLESLGKWWNERLEGLLAPAGTSLWGEMKQNAAALTGDETAGCRILFDQAMQSPVVKAHPLRLHLVGHSAGSIVHSYLIDRLATKEWEFETVSFMAPAMTLALFRERMQPWLEAGRIKRYNEYHLSDEAERQDPTCRPVLGYGRSLLYLVSRSFEGGAETPIFGMEKYFPAEVARMRRVKVFVAPSQDTASTTHGGFDDDGATMRSLIAGMD